MQRSFPDTSVDKESGCQCRRPQFDSWVGKILWRRDRLPTPVFLGFCCDSADKESSCNAGHLGSITGLEGSPGEGKSYPLQYSDLENSMGCIDHGISKSWTGLSHFDFLCRRSNRFYSVVQFSHSVVSDSLRPHELQHARPPCPLPTPGVYPSSCPLSR